MAAKIGKTLPDIADFKLDDYPLYHLNRTAATYTAKMTEILKTIGVGQPEWRVLMILNDKNPSTVSELSRRSVTKLSTITRIVIRMEEDGLVTRSRCNDDSRVTQVSITDDGRRVVVDLHEIASRIYERAFTGMDEGTISSFVDILKHIRANLNEAPAV
ncbi:hypothetical protein GCM10017044_04410 [Kordiimonas sediminis]|uniref:HTH marR-type domain-containing protein n=1 Tax=Kordiimonas sediminis TaxID=1735581 RepID=A0A919E2Q3_9PROT|nr:MarR family transcriptional regulator [Kordiimonas sediminis]GHF13486.1 hypothetical protein GCM10017044_04410 [Kordiimonas sediminis]